MCLMIVLKNNVITFSFGSIFDIQLPEKSAFLCTEWN